MKSNKLVGGPTSTLQDFGMPKSSLVRPYKCGHCLKSTDISLVSCPNDVLTPSGVSLLHPNKLICDNSEHPEAND